MKSICLLVFATSFFVILAGCASAPGTDFVQGRIRITPPIQFDQTPTPVMADGGTFGSSFIDAKGRKFDYYIDHRLDTKTPGAMYLFNYPGRWRSVRIKNEADFRHKLELPITPPRRTQP